MRDNDRLPARTREPFPDLDAPGDPPAWLQALLYAGVLAVVIALLLREVGVL